MSALPSVEQSSQTINSQSSRLCARTLSSASDSVAAPLCTLIIALTSGIVYRLFARSIDERPH